MPQTTVDRDAARRRAATALVATELVGDVARKLGRLGIPVMPVKGALLQHWLYEDPSERPLSDVDLLVLPDDFGRAIEALESEGYRWAAGSGVGAVVMHTPLGLALDLHPRLFDRARYRMPTHELFGRSSEDSALYGARVRLPSPLDVYAHLIGKFGSDHLDARSTARLDELARMAAHLDAPAETVARHLVHCGMRRVSRYVLPLVYRAAHDAFALRAHDALPSDPIGRGIVAAANLALAEGSERHRLGAVAAHLLNDSVPRGFYSGMRASLRRSRRG